MALAIVDMSEPRNQPLKLALEINERTSKNLDTVELVSLGLYDVSMGKWGKATHFLGTSKTTSRVCMFAGAAATMGMRAAMP